jgi:hypothetical protein
LIKFLFWPAWLKRLRAFKVAGFSGFSTELPDSDWFRSGKFRFFNFIDEDRFGAGFAGSGTAESTFSIAFRSNPDPSDSSGR